MIVANFTPFPVLGTERMVLRKLEATDDEDNFFLRSDDSVNKYLPGFRHTTIDQTQAFIAKILKGMDNNEYVFWTMILKGTNKFVGSICLWNLSEKESKAETGYTLHPNFQGNGYMHEALEKIIEYGFNTMRLKSIEAYTHKDNEKSTQLLLKSNFILDPTRKPEEGGDDVVFIVRNKNT